MPESDDQPGGCGCHLLYPSQRLFSSSPFFQAPSQQPTRAVEITSSLAKEKTKKEAKVHSWEFLVEH
jgi:hypothetical protein